jgi:hypothetical protein
LFLFTDNANAELHLLNQGELRFFEGTNSFYCALTVSNSLAGSVTWTLPLLDAAADGEILVSDALGALRFEEQVAVGTLNALAYYDVAGRHVTPAATATYTGTGFGFTGALFGMVGASGATPTSLQVKAGDGVGVAGGSLSLFAGDSNTPTLGSILMGIGTTDYLRLEDVSGTAYLSITDGVSLRFEDSLAAYVGFTAPSSVTTPVIWELPAADGAANQTWTTDGSGALNFNFTLNPGTTNAFTYYSGPSAISASSLLIPASLPAGADLEALVVDNTGQVQTLLLVTPGASGGEIAYYTAGQTVGWSALFTFDDVNGRLELKNQTSLRFYEDTANGTNFIELVAPVALASSYSLTLPDTAPVADQVLTATSPSVTAFGFADDAPSRQKRG